MTENNDKPQHSELVESQIRHNHPNLLPATSRSWLQVSDIMTEDVATVCPGSSVVSAAKIMSDKNISCIIVSDNGNLSGIITETDLLKRAVAKGKDFRKMTVEQIMSSPVRSLPRDLSVLDAGKIMEAEKIRRLVVVEDERLVGILTQTDIVRVLASYSMWKNVSELMTSDVAVIASSATAKEAAEVMASRNISCLVALDNDAVAGIFTERDLLKRVIALKRNPVQTILKNVMSSPVMSVPSNYSIPSASKIMEKKKIRRLLVMDDLTLLGVVTQTDILKAIKGRLQEEEENYFRFLNESRNCIYIVDLNNNTTYVNPALMKLLKITNPEELINKSFLPERFWDNPDQRDQILGQLKKSSVEVHDLTLRTTQGNKLFVTLFSTRTKNIKGQTNGSQGVLYDITKQKQAEEKLKQAAEEWQSTFDSVTDLVSVHDKDFKFIRVNKACVDAFNMKSEEFVGKACYEVIHGIKEPWPNCPHNKALKTRQTVTKEFFEPHLGIYLDVSVSPILGKNGEVLGGVHIAKDITERKQAEEALQKAHDELEVRIEQRKDELTRANKILKSEIAKRKKAEEDIKAGKKRLQDIMESMVDGITITDMNGKIISINKAATEQLGYTNEEVISKTPGEVFIAEKDIPKFLEAVKKVASGKTITNQEYLIKHKDGRTFPVSVNLSVLRDLTGKSTVTIAVHRDITERKAEEETLDIVNKCFLSFGPNPDKNINKIVETAGLILGGTCALYNKEEGPLLCTRGEWNIPEDFKREDNKEGHICYDVININKDEPIAINGLDETLYAQTDPNVTKYKLKTYVGCAVKVHDKAVGALCVVFQKNRVFNSNELKIFYILAEALGVEEDRKKAEDVLEKLNIDLESTVRELKRTNMELQEFAYITAHDLKTPLRGIGTLAEWLSTDYADKFDEQGQKQVKLLAERAKRADKLVDSILQYSSAGHFGEEQEQVDLNTVLPEIICEIAPAENIEITIENKLPVLMCQKTHISLVFENLLSNAVKHMDKKKGQIKVGCLEEDGFWKFSIADNGPGIDQKYFKKIFKIFQTLSSSDETESTGIGLPIAKKIVKMSAGRIWVESNPGEGSTFFFTLPKSDVKQEAPAGVKEGERQHEE